MQSSPSQTWSAQGYASNARFVADLAGDAVALLAPRPGQRILDLGCGDGALTLRLQGLGAQLVGVDAAPELVDAARVSGLDVRLQDAHALTFAHEFDAVFSNAALHWMRDPDAVVAGVARALVPRGRFAGEFGGHGNVAAIVVALRAVVGRRGIDPDPLNPWYFPAPAAFAALLERHGFNVETIGLHPRPTVLPTEMTGWLRTFANPYLGALPADQREAALEETVALLRPVLFDGEQWTADYVRLRFAARLR
ncbi:MAG TPA: methyltransferase domain-containing protein [Candidatus Elarobacter sp.]